MQSEYSGSTAQNIGKDSLLVLTGTIEAVIYQNADNGYSVVELEDENGDLNIVVGSMPYIAVGEKINAFGEWTHHATYGRQFKAEYYEKNLPVEEGDILRYLASGAVKGIGPKTAARIVEKFGEETFDIIENHPEWLAEIPGISKSKAIKINESFVEKSGSRAIMMFCRDYLTPAAAMRIYKKWGSGAIDILQNNPYKLCTDFSGIGFRRADSIASSMGIAADSRERIVSGINYVLSNICSQNGHTCVEKNEVISTTSDLLGLSREVISDTLTFMLSTGELIEATDKNNPNRVLIEQASYYNAEKYTAEKLNSIMRLCPAVSDEDVGRFIHQIEVTQSMEYASLQKKAIYEALENGVMVLTGGPGTGKTTVIRALLKIFDNMGHECVLAAPTGRAAKRMSEATSCEAKTIHRMLEMEYTDEKKARFARDEHNHLDEDVIIIDEASMIDSVLMEALLKAIKPGARLILIGDSQQLPSVGAGNVLRDIIDSGKVKTVELTEIFRQSSLSLIIRNAHAINQGKMPDITVKNNDFFFLRRNNDEEIAYTVADLYKNRLPKTYGADTINRIQIITPSRKGAAGTEMLNIRLQEMLNPPSARKNEHKSREIIFREGDRVMQIRNNYTLEWEKDGKNGIGIFNGDIGVIEEIDSAEEMMLINFDDRRVFYDFALLDELEHSYAITVHKSQGSEYPIVIIPMYNCPPLLLTRNLLYTAVTRAQDIVVMVGREDILRTMVENNRQIQRNTNLCSLLKNYKK